MANNKRVIPAEGSKFNFLTVICFSHQDRRNRKHYLCICDCGNRKTVQGSLLVSGNTKSCGCMRATLHKERFLLPENKGVINQIILGYKRHALDRGFQWKLTFEQVKTLIAQPCTYCGAINSNKKITKNCKEGFGYNGIDRIDSSLDYTSENVTSCCGLCNRGKGALSKADFLNWIERVYNHSLK